MQYPFPPGILTAPWTYGMALFADAIAAVLSGTILVRYFYERRSIRQMVEAFPLTHVFLPNRIPAPTLLSSHVIVIHGFLWMIFLRSFPDTLWMLCLWEVDDTFLTKLFLFDYAMDFFALVPFTAAVIVWFWTRQSLAQHLMKADEIPLVSMSLPSRWELAKLFGLVAFISIGLAFSKVVM